jgi:hypothetical protein
MCVCVGGGGAVYDHRAHNNTKGEGCGPRLHVKTPSYCTNGIERACSVGGATCTARAGREVQGDRGGSHASGAKPRAGLPGQCPCCTVQRAQLCGNASIGVRTLGGACVMRSYHMPPEVEEEEGSLMTHPSQMQHKPHKGGPGLPSSPRSQVLHAPHTPMQNRQIRYGAPARSSAGGSYRGRVSGCGCTRKGSSPRRWPERRGGTEPLCRPAPLPRAPIAHAAHATSRTIYLTLQWGAKASRVGRGRLRVHVPVPAPPPPPLPGLRPKPNNALRMAPGR